MRLFVTFIFATLITAAAHAATPAPHLLGLSFTADDQATSLEIDLSARAPLSTIVKPDRIEIDLPTAAWDRSFPVKGSGGGLIESYRKLPIGRGIAIVMRTNGRTKIDNSAGATAEDGTQHVTIRLVSDSPPPALVNTVTLVEDPTPTVYTGPIIQTIAPAQTPAQTAAPATQPAQLAVPQRQTRFIPSKQTDCVSHLVQTGRLGDSSASYPVYKFSDCP